MAGVKTGQEVITPTIEYDSEPYGRKINQLVNIIEGSEILIGFNIKFDLHWLKRYCPDFNFMGRIWDCQLGEFILNHQSRPYPDLASSCSSRDVRAKLDRVRTEYWEKGFDTTEVPKDLLIEYLVGDLESTYELYQKQRELFESSEQGLYSLFKAQCADLLVLQDCEWNGMLYDTDRSLRYAEQTLERIRDTDRQLTEIVGCDKLNWNSGDHLSSVLYGGEVYYRVRVPTSRTLKSGEVKVREKWGEASIRFPGMVRPLPRTETKPTNQWDDKTLQDINRKRQDDGKRPFVRVYRTDASTLKSLAPKSKQGKKLIELILSRAELEKLHSTYYQGIPDLLQEMDWPKDVLHGQFNQVVAATGRLSSSRPNLQNFAGDIKELFYSRYNNNKGE